MKQMKLILSTAALLATTPAFAQEAATAPNAQAMQQMMALIQPGEKHQLLNSIAGNWNYTMSYRMQADAPAEKSTGTSINEWVLDGRYIKQVFSGSMQMGEQKMTYNGLGYIGHDNAKDEYISLWMDNMSTAPMMARGTYNKKSKLFEDSGSHYCAMRGREVKFRSEIKIIGDNSYSLTMYDTTGAEEYKSMEILYTRQ